MPAVSAVEAQLDVLAALQPAHGVLQPGGNAPVSAQPGQPRDAALGVADLEPDDVLDESDEDGAGDIYCMVKHLA